jgi:peptidoglycan/LPS O-acetylase OafA/YrhL
MARYVESFLVISCGGTILSILAFCYTFILELDKFKRYQLIIFLILLVVINLFSPRLIIIQNVFFGILSCIIILLSDRRLNLYLFKILDQKFLIFLGKISYGLYVYHNFIPWLIRNLNGTEIRYQLNFKYSILPRDINPIIWFLLSMMLLISISSISWFFIEKPILKLKSKFNT